jgi:Salmonella virulence plasmid 65kDa B protein
VEEGGQQQDVLWVYPPVLDPQEDRGRDEPASEDQAVVADPARRDNVFAWRLTKTQDTFGNQIVYGYERDLFDDGTRQWDQLYLKSIKYVDYEDDAGEMRFLVYVKFVYEDELEGRPRERPDPFSTYRPGFEIRTRRRCKRIERSAPTPPKKTRPVIRARWCAPTSSSTSMSG